VLGLLLPGAFCCFSAEKELRLESADLILEAGTKRVYAYSTPEGGSRGELINVTTESMRVGDAVLNKYVEFDSGGRRSDLWATITPRRMQAFNESSAKTPFLEFDLPMKTGLSGRVSPVTGGNSVRITRQERITVPAGTFDCLVLELEDNRTPVLTLWQAAGAGVVQMKSASGLTFVLMAIRKPAAAATGPGSGMMCDFDSGDPLSSSLFPNGRWRRGFGAENTNVVCSVEADPAQAALGTAMSMRWAYHIKGRTWVQTDFLLTGSWKERADFTAFDSVSFQIKGFKPGSCKFMVHAQPVKPGDNQYVNLPVSYATEWNRVTIDLRDPALSTLDLTKTAQISFGHLGRGDDANVVWIDQIELHEARGR
jgi:hypothetical protein